MDRGALGMWSAIEIVSAICLILFVWWRFFFFFRNPKRIIPTAADIVLSPADGFIVYIRKIRPEEPIFAIKKKQLIRLGELFGANHPRLSGQSGYLIGIYMSALDVHYNRSPIAGQIRKIAHCFPTASRENRTMFRGQANLIFGTQPPWSGCDYIITNERASYIVENERMVVFVTQIADRWIKKIVTYRETGPIAQGEIFGFIRMGSQVDVFVPESMVYRLEPLSKERQHAKAGLTPLFRIHPSKSSGSVSRN